MNKKLVGATEPRTEMVCPICGATHTLGYWESRSPDQSWKMCQGCRNVHVHGRPWRGCCGQCIDDEECRARRAQAESIVDPEGA